MKNKEPVVISISGKAELIETTILRHGDTPEPKHEKQDYGRAVHT
jgi:hypothetical protein